MDKYEYKIRSDEIKSLIEEKAYAQAAEIADTIDWRRVKSVRTLCMISDLYKANRRFEDAKNMLLLAYDKRPGGKTICYSLCEICIKTGEFVQALKYCDEFVKVAPKDSGRYILKYKLYEAQEVSLEERIGVLEELKKRDYREKWAYELAYLYHRVGLATRCVEECDELILWFGDGKYVVKAMELKMLHQPLTPSQQAVYDRRFDRYEEESVQTDENGQTDDYGDQTVYDENDHYYEQTEEAYPYESYEGEDRFYGEDQEGAFEPEEPAEMDIQVKTMDVGKYNTINLQEELAAGLQEVLGAADAGHAETQPESGESLYGDAQEGQETEETEVFFGETGEMEGLESAETREQFPAEEQPGENGLPEETAAEDTLEPAAHADSGERDLTCRPGSAELTDTLAQEEDGQISLVLPGETAVEKQITGQMNIDDILDEWERTKKESEAKCREEVRQRVLRQTGPMFTEFEAAVRDDLLVKLEESGSETFEAVPERDRDGEPDDAGNMELSENYASQGENAFVQTPECQGETGYAEAAVYEDSPELSEGSFDDAQTAYLEEDDRNAWEYEDVSEYTEEAYIPEAEQDEAEAVDWNYAEEGEYEAEEDRIIEEEISAYPEEEDGGGAWEYAQESGYEEFSEQEEGEVYEDSQAYIEDTGEDGEWEFAQEPEGEEADPELSGEEVYGDREIYMAEEEDSADWDFAGEPEGEEAAPELSGDREIYMAEEEDSADWDFAGEPEEEEAFLELPEEEVYGDQEPYMAEEEETVDWDLVKEPVREETVPEEDGSEIMGQPVEEWDLEAGTSEALDYMEALEQLEDLEDGEEVIAGKSDQGEKKTGRNNKKDSERAEKITEVPEQSEKKALEHDKARVRSLSREEKELFAPFIQSRQSREQLVKALDGISMAAYTGNVIITGEEGMDTLTLARNMIREVSMTDRNFSGKVAKISGQGLNQKDVRETLERLHNGALIIQKASGMDSRTAGMLHMALQQEKFGIIVILEDTKKAIQKLFLGTPALFGDFTARMDLEALSNDLLVSFGRRYAREKEYSIDDLGVLALHTRIEECQTIDHVVTVIEVKQIVDEAIRHASRKTLGHFLDILLARRYDDEDMIILTEKDFVA